MEDLRGKVALVTGGSSGIGAALVARLARVGCDVAVGWSGNRAGAQAAVDDALAQGVHAVALQADVTDADAVVAQADAAAEALGPIDVLVPNAGVGTPAGLAAVDPDLWSHTLAVNLTAPFLLAHHVVPAMAERGFGRVLFVSSIAAFTGGGVGPHYAASKAGLHGLVYWIAAEYAARGVTANAIAPALIGGTGMIPPDHPGAARVPVGRLGTLEENTDLALTMLTSGYLTGKVFLLDGGIRPQ